MDSEYLVTLLVVVPLALQPDWNNRVSCFLAEKEVESKTRTTNNYPSILLEKA